MEDLAYYLEWKNEIKYTNSAYKQTINHLRPGIKLGNFYFEGGYFSEGDFSAEAGYKFKLGPNLLLKGKWEGTQDDNLKHKLETEVRWTF